MIKDGQVKELRRLLGLGRTLILSARMTEMTDKTARNYRDDERLPSQRKKARDYRTRIDPFIEIWPEIQRKLEGEPALKAKTLFEWIQETHPGQFEDSTRRTFERRVLQSRSLQGRRTPRCIARNHQGVAEAVRSGWADAGVCLQLVSEEAGLKFLPVQTESCDICFPASLTDDRRVKALLKVVRSVAYRRLMGNLPGYETNDTGSFRSANQ